MAEVVRVGRVRADGVKDLRRYWMDVRGDFRAVSQSLTDLHARLGRVESSVQQIAKTQGDQASFEKRIALLEEGQKITQRELVRRTTDGRWMVGVFVGVGATVVPILTYLMTHLHWR